MKRITGSLVVCSGAALFTAGALLFADDSASSPAASPAPSGSATSGQFEEYPGGAQNSAPEAAAAMTIADFTFSSATAAPGATVTVTNADGVQHTASSPDFDTGVIDAGAAGTFVAPAAPGTYEFICNIHPTMQGELVVA
jgi:plastocyanin